ncbi:hypothetical protein Tco_1299200 [Tanacetum coccineum]
MDAIIQHSSVEKQCLEIAKKELLLENDRLLQQIMSQDVILTMMNYMSLNGESVNMERKRNESCDKCFNLDAQLLKSQNAHNDLLKSYSQLEKHSQLQDKDTTICKLKEIIKSMREKSKEENVNYDYCEIETKNVELENSVAKLLLENEHLCNEINHVKQVFKEQFDSIKKTRVRTKEHSHSLIDKLNLKSAENEDLKAQIQDKVVDTPKNKVKKVRFAELLTSSSNVKEVESSKTSDSNIPVLSPTGLKCSTSNCGSKPTGNKKNDRILQTPSRNMKNTVEVVQIVLWYLDSGCSKHMAGNCSHLMNFVSKFMGIVRFENDHIARIISPGLGLHSMTPATSSSGLGPNTISQQPCIPPNKDDWDHVFQPMFDEYFNPPSIVVILVQDDVAPRVMVLADSTVSRSIDQDAPSSSIPSTQEQEHSPNISQGFKESPKTLTFRDDPLHESLHEESTSQGSSLNVKQIHTPFKHLCRWTKDHPIANVIGKPSCSVSTRKQL